MVAPRLHSLVAALWPVALLLQPVLSAEYVTADSTTPRDNSPNCSCYVVKSGADSNTPEYFQYYRFYDFRNLADRSGQYIKAPPIVDDWDDAPDMDATADVFESDAWNKDWGIQGWNKTPSENFPTPIINSPGNVFLQQNPDSDDATTYLTLRTSKTDDFQTAAEIENEQKNIMHISMRMYGRVVGDKGAVAGFFTFYDDENESDIEILTRDAKDVIRYTNQPAVDDDGNEVTAASHKMSKLPSWDEWQTHRIDWLPKDSYWYLNEKQVAANTYSVPRKPSYLVINMWSDGGEWSGNMTNGGSAEFHIQWIEMTFNTSGPAEGTDASDEKRAVGLFGKREEEGCKVVCKIDDVKQKGTPEIVDSMATHVSLSWCVLAVVGLTSLWVGL